MRRTFLLATFLCLTASASQARAQTDVETQAQELDAQLLKAHVGFAAALTSPGASIQVKEVSRSGPSVTYHFFVAGLPTDTTYTSVNWPINAKSPSATLQGITIGKDGLLICAGRQPDQCGDPSKKDDPIEFIFYPAKAEPFRLAFISSDSQSKVATVIVPDPIKSEDKGCSLEVVRLLPKFELAYVVGKGFPANTDVQFDLQSYDEKHKVAAKTDTDGNLNFMLMPFVLGHDKGTTSVKTVPTRCAPNVKFDWGR